MDIPTLRIILLSDIHASHENIKKVREWILYSKEKIDYIFLLGDFLNLINEDPIQYQDQQANLLCERAIKEMLQEIYSLNIPTLYIPGNHDPRTMYDQNHESFFSHFHNIHGRIHKIADDLQVLGFGGSIPGYLMEEQIWTGFPFNNEKEFEDAFAQVEDQFANTTTQTILMTHVGASISSTTQSYQEDYRVIESGSHYLTKFLRQNSRQIVVNLHGHTHDGHGYRRINDLQVVNAGPLVWGKFTVIELRRTPQNQWELGNVALQSL